MDEINPGNARWDRISF